MSFLSIMGAIFIGIIVIGCIIGAGWLVCDYMEYRENVKSSCKSFDDLYYRVNKLENKKDR